MNWDVIKGEWKQFNGKVREKWGKLTDDDLTVIGGMKDQLVGKLQERYGYAKGQAEREIDDFARDCDTNNQPTPAKSPSVGERTADALKSGAKSVGAALEAAGHKVKNLAD